MLIDKNLTFEDFIKSVNANTTNKKVVFGDIDYAVEEIGKTYYDKLSVYENGMLRCPKNRLSYNVEWYDDCPKKLVFVLFNPSIANSVCLDETLKNCVKIAYALNSKIQNKSELYGGMKIFNTFTVRHPIVDEAIKILGSNYDYEFKNNAVFSLEKSLNRNDTIILAWGNDVKKYLPIDYFEKLKTVLNNFQNNGGSLFAYKCNISGAKQPSHPSPRCIKFVKEFCANPVLLELNNNFENSL